MSVFSFLSVKKNGIVFEKALLEYSGLLIR